MEAESIREIVAALIAPVLQDLQLIRESLLSKNDFKNEIEALKSTHQEELRARDEEIIDLKRVVDGQATTIQLQDEKISAFEERIVEQENGLQSLKEILESSPITTQPPNLRKSCRCRGFTL